MNQGWTYQEKVNSQGAGQTLLDYYCQNYQHSSREEWQSRILAGQILIDHEKANPETILKKGQALTYQRSPWEEPDVPLDFVTLYEDADLMIIAKPSGLPVLPGGGFLQNTLLYQLQQRYPQEMPVPVHRLGRGTSGLMLIARSSLAKSKLSQQMRDRQISKIYRALIGPSQLPTEFTINQAIGKIPHPILGYIYGATPTGKFAQSDCRVLEKSSTKTLLEITILTGRPHQIRIHLAAIGYPLLGDPLYDVGGIAKITSLDSKISIPSDCGYSLHAHQLSFLHPTNQEKISFISPPPPELMN